MSVADEEEAPFSGGRRQGQDTRYRGWCNFLSISPDPHAIDAKTAASLGVAIRVASCAGTQRVNCGTAVSFRIPLILAVYVSIEVHGADFIDHCRQVGNDYRQRFGQRDCSSLSRFELRVDLFPRPAFLIEQLLNGVQFGMTITL